MATQNYTPGPWQQDTLGGTTVWPMPGKNLIAQCTGFEREVNVANARLIAAAPELLKALIECRDCLTDVAQGKGGWAWEDVLDTADAAIGKAQ